MVLIWESSNMNRSLQSINSQNYCGVPVQQCEGLAFRHKVHAADGSQAAEVHKHKAVFTSEFNGQPKYGAQATGGGAQAQQREAQL